MAARTRHPFPVPLKTYDESIAVLRRSLDAAKVGDTEKIDGMKRLDKFVRAVEKRYAPEADFDAVMAHEHAISQSLDGRSVFDPSTRDAAPRRAIARSGQVTSSSRCSTRSLSSSPLESRAAALSATRSRSPSLVLLDDIKDVPAAVADRGP